MAQFVVRLFGVVRIEQAGKPFAGFRSTKARALFAYLVVEGKPVPRHELAALLWDGFTPAAALTNLRQTLANLRKLLKPFNVLKSTRHTIHLNLVHPDIWCDFVALQTMLDANSADVSQRWQTLAPYMDNEFLHDLATIDSAPFQVWRAAKRVMVREQVAQLQLKLRQPRVPLQASSHAITSPATTADGPQRGWIELSRRLCDPDYPFLSLAPEVHGAHKRLALADALQIDPNRVQQTLHALTARPPTIQALLLGAWQSITPMARSALLNCVVFRGGFTETAVQAIANISRDVLAELATQGLLTQHASATTNANGDPDPHSDVGESRFFLPDLVRQFAEVQLSDAILGALQLRHATYYLELLASWDDEQIDKTELLDWFHQEEPNIDVAWQWATEHNAIELLRAALRNRYAFFVWTDSYLGLLLCLRRTVTYLRQVTTTDQAKARSTQALLLPLLRYIAVGHRALGQYDQALQVTHEVLVLATALHSRNTEVSCYFELGSIAYFQGDYEQATLFSKKGIALAKAYEIDYWQLQILLLAGLTEQNLHRYQSALAHFQQAQALLEPVGDPDFYVEMRHRLIMLHLCMGDLAQAATLLQTYGLDAYQRKNYYMAAITACNRGFLHLLLGHYVSAEAALQEAEQLSQKYESRRVEAVALSLSAMLYAQQNQTTTAELYCARAMTLAESGGFQQTVREISLTRGHLYLRRGQAVAAREAYSRALLLSKGNDAPTEEAEAHAHLATAICAQGDGAAALRHVERVLEIFAIAEFQALQSPQWLLLCCYQVLTTLHDPRSPAILSQAWIRLQAQAGSIRDEEQRHSYLMNVPYNRQLVQLIQGGSAPHYNAVRVLNRTIPIYEPWPQEGFVG